MQSRLQTLSAAAATALDKELMSTGAFSIDQLMELAGLSVSQVVYRVHPPAKGNRVLVACGPGNNGEPSRYISTSVSVEPFDSSRSSLTRLKK